MTFGNGNNTGEGNTHANKYSFSFYKGQPEEAPYFKVKQFSEMGNKVENELPNCKEIQGTLKGVFYNKSDNPQYSDELKILLESGDSLYYVSFRVNNVVVPVMNSILAAEKGQEVRIATYVNKEGYKNIGVFNPAERKDITTKDGKTVNVEASFQWVYKKDELPEVVVTKNPAGKVVDVDDAALNAFFAEKIAEKFDIKKDENTEGNVDANELSVEDVPF